MTTYQVKVVSVGDGGAHVIKSLRLVANLGLADAKGVYDFLRTSTPRVLVGGIDRDVADHSVALLANVGVQSVVEESSLDSPMRLCPEANWKYRWNWWKGPTRISRHA